MSKLWEGRVALYLQDKHPILDGIHYVRRAEELGFEAVWQAESRLVREATVPMAAFAATTSTIRVGSGVVDIQIDIVHGDRSARHIPIYVGATGMRMMELAGEIADGVVLNYLVSPTYNDEAMARLAEGAARVGRTVDQVDRPQLVVCSLDDDREVALDRARELVTQYLGQQPHIGKASGVDQSLLDDIAKELTWPATPEQIRKAMALVPDEVVQMLTASGTADECRAKVREYVASGCTSPILYPLGDDVDAMLEAFAGGAGAQE